MAATTAHLEANTNQVLRKPTNSATDNTSNEQPRIWRIFAKSFWTFTEKTGAADLSSYKGLL